ncbi:tautomerase family protein [Desulfovibrio legallii]|jgi:4-oxalocrotonate tautomerase|uniref:Tautomerase n=1 Tax=Desulfovibrio legallii TaxID=571438 RepID=A0A1G7JS16_9BACT|nr:4-oxalocrotonate tautomerase family protein [Desulfovibrio legallii]SDF27742.1 4-oxalocrotonate tautomerase [Desulfovibrio legallii]
MPYVNIKVTGGAEAPTTAQKAELIQGVTDLLARVLGKNPATTVVIIDEVPMDNWGIGGATVTSRRQQSGAGAARPADPESR